MRSSSYEEDKTKRRKARAHLFRLPPPSLSTSLLSMLEGIRKASDTFHAKKSKKAAQQHEEFKKQIDEALSGVKKDIEDGWEEDEATM